jgi:hypothetical protein
VLGADSWFYALVSRWPDSLSRCCFLVLAATGQVRTPGPDSLPPGLDWARRSVPPLKIS